MGRIWEGALVAKGLTFGIVVSRTNEFITARLLEGIREARTAKRTPVKRPSPSSPTGRWWS